MAAAKKVMFSSNDWKELFFSTDHKHMLLLRKAESGLAPQVTGSICSFMIQTELYASLDCWNIWTNDSQLVRSSKHYTYHVSFHFENFNNNILLYNFITIWEI